MAVSNTWDVTVNNYEDEDIELFRRWSEDVSRMTIAKEVGENGTPHLQGRITFKRAYRLTGLKKLAPKYHWEPTKCAQDHLYIQKSGSEIVIDKNNRQQGKRTDLSAAVESLKAGGLKRVAEEHPETYVKFHRGFSALRDQLDEPRDFAPEVHVRWGEPGSGKTRYVYEKHSDVWDKPSGDWYDGYNGQEVVIFDDFYGCIKYNEFLKLLDRYPMRVPVKGGFVQWRPRIIYVTSNVPPERWYRNIEDKRALLRRLTTITKVGDANYRGHDAE